MEIKPCMCLISVWLEQSIQDQLEKEVFGQESWHKCWEVAMTQMFNREASCFHWRSEKVNDDNRSYTYGNTRDKDSIYAAREIVFETAW